MLIGSYGEFWQRDLVDWNQHGWRLLGRRNLRAPALQITDFRRARGVYVLYDDVGTYYVGLAGPRGTIGARLKAHTTDHLAPYWSRFSWFSFDSPSAKPNADGIREVDQYDYYFHGDAVEVVIRDFEALLQRAAGPVANVQRTNFANGKKWIQVATCQPEVRTLEDLRPGLTTSN